MKSLLKLYKENTLNVLGLMSGTSMDGLDVCLSEVKRISTDVKASIIYFSSYPYSKIFKNFLMGSLSGTSKKICHANFEITRKWTEMIKVFLAENNLSMSDIDLIGSHGQTIWHIHGDSTLQIGEASVLAEEFKVPVVSDFRVRDVAAGGSGAPLVPYMDYLLFKDYGRTFLILNIGGIANFTIVPKSTKSIDDIYALDTGPGVALIDAATFIVTDGEMTFDKDGKLAEKGKIREDILNNLMKHPYIKSPIPKSTGREVFGDHFVEEMIKSYHLNKENLCDFVATLTRFTVEAIYSNYEQFFAEKYPLDEIIVSGGGTNNPVIMQHLKDIFCGVKISRADDYGINIDAKEAFAFAILAAHTIWGQAGNVPNVTGAKHPVVLGKIAL
ncbi:MAG: anhydro-N-acetylmuramic acid kinase [Candidatus Marinimicrobia bacterium]|nr:anhydro-N-acetylmuramic acid kinase [Candidatus Neomarinimicrobiota bacterium]